MKKRISTNERLARELILQRAVELMLKLHKMNMAKIVKPTLAMLERHKTTTP